ncbi:MULTISPECIES: hypothetical protein [Listeria]|uniref:hypothetical protein n=1 Tax=Listeria TaxID=1637 RepID=UPI000EC8BE10|nr:MULTISPECIES: hypothetical protein [Listeria]EHT7656849.1 hypothetical protein [Listeria monocytogenes]EJM2844695.1 hypothetical protein [Listeria monocytogenes]EJM2847672.1 hypothetical protein [Listeria monocytogenes]EJM2850602.1 hypothetical protein [Listeria monocytogenes]EJM2871153.1 hypothetical protein [Listeria monocytogenes]
MMQNFNLNKQVDEKYLNNRLRVLNYTNKDMNLALENSDQVYIALFDIPVETSIMGFHTETLALVFGLNVHLYHGSGSAITNLEQYPEVMKAMQSFLISSSQVLPYMELTKDMNFYNSKYPRVYLKTEQGIFLRELCGNDKIDNFLQGMMNYIIDEITKTGVLKK